MKKIPAIILALLIGAAAILAIYRFGFRKSIPDAPQPEQVMAILNQNDCFVCHSQTPELPFYSKLPIIGPRMAEHIDHARRFIDLESKTASITQADEVTLAMLEHAVAYNTMPIHEYRMIHWGTGFTKKEKAILADWILEQRCGAEAITPIPDAIEVDAAKAELGERMYNDTRISLDGTISCASCHILADGGADEEGDRTSEGIYGQFGGVNAPTVYNAFFNVRQFWNGRAADLREQAAGPPVNPVEMGDQTWDQIVSRLREDKGLVKEFEALYPGEGLTEFTVTSVIAEFEKTLLTPDSRFDLYLKGDKEALTADELAGFEAFKKNACATCHTGVILGGRSFEEIGIFADYFADRSSDIVRNSDDDGLKGFTGNDADFQKFKTPGLRNVSITAPYFHDGTMATMEDAVKAMAKYELGKDLKDEDVNYIVAFMRTLTGRHPYLTAD
ncbi:MAG: heme-binding domain-containing protein [Bacteroidales bacterium]|nr:heme-binding domain-containing protein [Bacteroidales bacterium]